MPISEYFKGKGKEIMKNMKDKYGDKKGKKVFHATAKSKNMEPSEKMKRKHGVK